MFSGQFPDVRETLLFRPPANLKRFRSSPQAKPIAIEQRSGKWNFDSKDRDANNIRLVINVYNGRFELKVPYLGNAVYMFTFCVEILKAKPSV